MKYILILLFLLTQCRTFSPNDVRLRKLDIFIYKNKKSEKFLSAKFFYYRQKYNGENLESFYKKQLDKFKNTSLNNSAGSDLALIENNYALFSIRQGNSLKAEYYLRSALNHNKFEKVYYWNLFAFYFFSRFPDKEKRLKRLYNVMRVNLSFKGKNYQDAVLWEFAQKSYGNRLYNFSLYFLRKNRAEGKKRDRMLLRAKIFSLKNNYEKAVNIYENILGISLQKNKKYLKSDFSVLLYVAGLYEKIKCYSCAIEYYLKLYTLTANKNYLNQAAYLYGFLNKEQEAENIYAILARDKYKASSFNKDYFYFLISIRDFSNAVKLIKNLKESALNKKQLDRILKKIKQRENPAMKADYVIKKRKKILTGNNYGNGQPGTEGQNLPSTEELIYPYYRRRQGNKKKTWLEKVK